MSRFYVQWWERSQLLSLALLPRLRLTVGSSIGIGFAWLTVWFHMWLITGRRPHDTTMIEILPHLWFHWHRHWGCGLHLWWFQWKGHVWLYRPSKIGAGQ